MKIIKGNQFLGKEDWNPLRKREKGMQIYIDMVENIFS